MKTCFYRLALISVLLLFGISQVAMAVPGVAYARFDRNKRNSSIVAEFSGGEGPRVNSVNASVSKNSNHHRPKMYGRVVGGALFAVGVVSLVVVTVCLTAGIFGLVCPICAPATQIFAVSAVVGSLSLLIGALPLVLCNTGLNCLDEE